MSLGADVSFGLRTLRRAVSPNYFRAMGRG